MGKAEEGAREVTMEETVEGAAMEEAREVTMEEAEEGAMEMAMEATLKVKEKKWWHNKVVYQIYPRSFYDSNQDGIGDLKGICEKIPYLKELGVEIIWLCPVYQSPNDDNGYDISDYYNIMAEFGTMEDMQILIDECSRNNISIMMDLVLNHSSDEHPWFQEARKSKDNPYRDYYIWRDGTDGREPTDFQAFFGGSAWEYTEETGQYYLHTFSKKQPDLNWENPKMKSSLFAMVNFWIEKGVRGFRLDAIDYISKDLDNNIMGNGPRLHEFLNELNRNTYGKRADTVTVGETGGNNPLTARMYTKPEHHELDMIFQFGIIDLDGVRSGDWSPKPYTLKDIKEVLEKWQGKLEPDELEGLVLNNHDNPRSVSRYVSDNPQFRIAGAKMLATMLHGLKGVPFIYQGEELGMTNIKFSDISDYRDIETLNFYYRKAAEGWTEEKIMEYIYRNSRDNARTPMQWDDSKHAGFTKAEPWISVNPYYKDIHVKQCLEDHTSVFYHYQKLIRMRKDNEVLVYGDFRMICTEDEKVLAYVRTLRDKRLIIVCNFYEEETQINIQNYGTGKVLLSNYPGTQTDLSRLKLRPYEAVIFQAETVSL